MKLQILIPQYKETDEIVKNVYYAYNGYYPEEA